MQQMIFKICEKNRDVGQRVVVLDRERSRYAGHAKAGAFLGKSYRGRQHRDMGMLLLFDWKKTELNCGFCLRKEMQADKGIWVLWLVCDWLWPYSRAADLTRLIIYRTF